MTGGSGYHSGMDDELEEVFLGRQPILDRQQAIVGYELLFRTGRDNSAQIDNGRAATAEVVCMAFAELGLAKALGPQKAFINVDEDFLSDDAVGLLPKEMVVLEISAAYATTARVLERSRELRELGYEIALSGLTETMDGLPPMLALSSYLKVDAGTADVTGLTRLATKLRGVSAASGARMMASRVESLEQWKQCVDLGFHLFQGYYFAKPVIIEGRKLDASTQGLIRLINLLNQDAPMLAVESAFKHEPALSVNLLRLTNSVGVGLASKVTSIRHAVTVVGQRQLLRWLQLLLFSRGGGSIHNNPLMQLAALRGALMEMFAERCYPGKKDLCEPAFLAGLMSVMPAALGVPMTEILTQIAVAPEVRRALARQEGDLGQLLLLIDAYDANDADACQEILARLPSRVSFQSLGLCLAEAIAWVQQLGVEA